MYFCLLSCFRDAPVFLGLLVHVSKLVSDKELVCSSTTACVERSLQCLSGVFYSASVSLFDGQSLLVPLEICLSGRYSESESLANSSYSIPALCGCSLPVNNRLQFRI